MTDEQWGKRLTGVLLHRPLWVLGSLMALVVAVELLQSVPQLTWGGHALGEVVRNLAYALIGALAFQWLVVELPSRERRRKSYDFNRQTYELLVGVGPALLVEYSDAAKALQVDLDVWDEKSVKGLASQPQFSAQLASSLDRRQLVTSIVEVAVPRALVQLAGSVAFMDENVAHAFSLFPRQDGLTVLQVLPDPRGGIDPQRDAHIVWSLVVAARRLYEALLEAGAFDATIFGMHHQPAGGVSAPVPHSFISQNS